MLARPEDRALCLYAIAMLCFPGCGSSDTGPKRMEVSGTVKRGGVAVKAGGVRFLPTGDHNGPAANGAIEDGTYKFTTDDGPTAGRHRVVIHVLLSKDELMKMKAEPDNEGPKMQWEFEVTVPDGEPFEKDFNLDE